MTETEIRVLEKGLGFAPTPTKINETDLRADFNEFARKMRCKWFFRNHPTENFSEAPAFRVKSNWNPPKRHPAVEIFLSKLEIEIFSVLPGTPLDYNLSKEEWLTMRGLAEDRNFIIKVNKSVYIAESRQRYHKPRNNIFLHVSNHTLKDMYMLNYGPFLKIVPFIVPS